MSTYNPTDDIHLKAVSSWENQKFVGLSELERCQLYAHALDVIIQRANKTLSNATIFVIIDRVIHQNKSLFPLIGEIKLDDISDMFTQFAKTKIQPLPTDLMLSLKCLLIELLRVMGRITADILTSPLHKELMTVTVNAGKAKSKSKKVPEDT